MATQPLISQDSEQPEGAAQSLNPFAPIFAHSQMIHNPVARVLAKIGSAAGAGLVGAGYAADPSSLQAREAEVLLPGKQAALAAKPAVAAETERHHEATEAQATATGTEKARHDVAAEGTADTRAQATADALSIKQAGLGGKIEYNRGIPTAITDSTGKRWDAKDPNLPAELKPHLQTAQAAYDQATADQLKNKLEGYKVLAAPRWASVQLAQAKNAGEIYQVAGDADWRYERMTEDAKNALAGNQQSMVSLLANHIGMTLGLQKGARITKDSWQEAEKSTPLLQGLEAKFDDQGYLSGVVLTPQQINQMLELSRSQRDLVWDSVRAKATQEKALGVPVPERPTTATSGGHRVAAGAPTPGAVQDGYKFKGGDPSKKENWEKQ